jgi:hypothetical protein
LPRKILLIETQLRSRQEAQSAIEKHQDQFARGCCCGSRFTIDIERVVGFQNDYV